MDLTTDSRPAVRTVEIVPPSARAEAWNVLRVAALIVLGTWIYLADAAAPGPGEAGAGASGSRGAGAGSAAGSPRARDLMPYQRLFGSLGGEDQRMFRELQEGLLEAENARSASGRWPAPEALAEQGVPPFAGGPGRRLYRWQLRQDGRVVNYLGLPAGGGPAFLLLVQEPDPQAPAAVAAGQAVDEMHHRLPDGTLLHVSTWMRPGTLPAPAAGAVAADAAGGAGGSGAGVIAEPFARGWMQLLAGAVRR